MFHTGVLLQELRVLGNRHSCVRKLCNIVDRVSFRNGDASIPSLMKLLFCLSYVFLGNV